MSKKLEDLDLNEVAERTRIEKEFFEALIARDFDALSRFNVKGFLKILKREYDIDLNELGDEFSGFLGIKPEPKPDEIDSSKKVINSNLDHYARKGSNTWLWLIIVVVIIVLLFFVWQQGFLKALLPDESVQNQSEIARLSTNAAENNINVALNGFADGENVALEQNQSENGENLENPETASLGSSNANSAVSGTNLAENSRNLATQNALQNAAQNAINSQNSRTPQNLQAALNAANSENFAFITPSVRVWVGFIDLESKEKTSMITDKDFSVNLAKDQLLLTGGADLQVKKSDGSVQNITGGGSKRFLVKDGDIKEVSIKEFRSYNGGLDY